MFFLRILFSQPRIFALLLIFIFLSGVFALNTVPRQENPELAQRWSTVQTIYPGASPKRIETQILEPMEAKLREVYELNEIISGDSIFSATGITDGDLVKGIEITGKEYFSETLVTHKNSNTFEVISKKEEII